MTTHAAQDRPQTADPQQAGCCGGKKQATLPQKPETEKPSVDAPAGSHGCCKSTD